jgi:hypothetical protein
MVEVKDIYFQDNTSAFTATPSIVPLSSMSQGDNISTRSGNKITYKHLRVRMLLVPGAETIANQIRVVLIMWHPMTTPVIGDIFNNNIYDTLCS